MAYTNPRGLPIADMGPRIVTLAACTLADYCSNGTDTPAVGDVVTWSATGDQFVKKSGTAGVTRLGVVTKIEKAPAGTAQGFIGVEWTDLIRLVALPCSVLANATRGNACEKIGADTVAADWDAAGAIGTNKIMCVAKSAASGAGTILGAVHA